MDKNTTPPPLIQWIDIYPAFLFFSAILIIGNYVLLNLFLAVLLKFITDNNEEDDQKIKKKKQQELIKS